MSFEGENYSVNVYFAVLSNGWLLPTSFLKCRATLAISSLSSHLRLRNEVGYPTIFSASLTALFQSGFLECWGNPAAVLVCRGAKGAKDDEEAKRRRGGSQRAQAQPTQAHGGLRLSVESVGWKFFVAINLLLTEREGRRARRRRKTRFHNVTAICRDSVEGRVRANRTSVRMCARLSCQLSNARINVKQSRGCQPQRAAVNSRSRVAFYWIVVETEVSLLSAMRLL